MIVPGKLDKPDDSLLLCINLLRCHPPFNIFKKHNETNLSTRYKGMNKAMYYCANLRHRRAIICIE